MDNFKIMLNMKPLSVNAAWKGHRYKSDQYKSYQTEMLIRLPAGKLPPPPYFVYYEFGMNKLEDFDNPCKPIGDILQKKYGFNDNEIYEAHIRKVPVKRGQEYIKIHIEHITIKNKEDERD